MKRMNRRSSQFEIPASLVKYYLFCPRIPYLILQLGVRERVTENMVDGREEHMKFFKREKRKKRRYVNVFLRSEKYGISGYVDEILREGNCYVVVEYKHAEYRRRAVKSHLYQAACYALMVEENFGRVCRILLKYIDRDVSFPFTLGIKKYCISIINKIRRIYEGELVTCNVDRRKCRNCGYFKFCRGL